MKTFEEILKERIDSQKTFIGDVSLANMQRVFPGLWEKIKEAAEGYAREAINDHYEQLKDALVGTYKPEETPPQHSPKGREEETPQSNGRIIKKDLGH